MGLSSSIGQAIYKLRLKVGLTEEEVARAAEISRQHYVDVENGYKRVSVYILHKIAKELQISLIGLLEEVDIEGIKEYNSPNDDHYKNKIDVYHDLSLYFIGDKSLLESMKKVTIIGKKKSTEYGIKTGQALARWYAEQGYVIISGMEEGIEEWVHVTCLESGGKSIAVLNSGLGNINPKRTKELSDKIVDAGGLLLSKYHPFSSSKLSHRLDSRKIQVRVGKKVILVESQLDSCEMKIALQLIKEKKKITCVRPLDKDKGKAQGNMILIRDHSDMVMELTEDKIIISE